MDHSAHLADAKRDAVALWRTILAGDMPGMDVLAERTCCPRCLPIQAVVAGIWAMFPGTRLNEAGFLVIPDAERERLDRALLGLLAQVQDRGEVSR